MKVFLVGGAVRDKLLKLNKEPEKDWLVVGSDINSMLNLNFKQIGKSFPVFLHPITREEYALARGEKKVGKGYKGFEFDFSPTISLKQDLKRRDLTINAIAINYQGQLIDYYGGINDLKDKILRHISMHFIEDPLRVLRLARFYAKFYHLGFKIAPETKTLVKQILQSGELEYLTPDRIWLEVNKAIITNNPHIFFYILDKFNILDAIWQQAKFKDKFLSKIAKQNNIAWQTCFLASILDCFKPSIAINQQYILKTKSLIKLYKKVKLWLFEINKNSGKFIAEQLLDLFYKTNIWQNHQDFYLIKPILEIEFNNYNKLQEFVNICKIIDILTKIKLNINFNNQNKFELTKQIKKKRLQIIKNLI